MLCFFLIYAIIRIAKEGNLMAKRGVTKDCPICGKSFYLPLSKQSHVTCSRTCAARHFRDKGEDVTCKQCGIHFWRTLYAAKLGFGNYCSHRCWGETRKTPLGIANNAWKPWQRREWKDTKCARCDATEDLELDHILARSLGGLSTRENTQTLCKLCNLRKFQCEDLPAYLIKQQDGN